MSDAQARNEALDLGRSFCVRAPAGSGKTGLLISRMLAALATVDQPEQVLAITFTRKAAAEIRERVTAALQAAANGPPPEDAFGQQLHRLASAVLHRDAEQGWALHLSPQRIRATTIDSLNRELARQMPVLSGLGSNLAPIDDARELYRSALQAALDHLEDPDGPPALRASLEATLALGQNRLDALLESLSPLLATRERWLQGQQDQSAQALIDAARQDLSRWTETALQDLDRALYRAARSEWLQALGQLAEAGVPDWQELKGLNHWPGCSPAELPTWQALARSLLTKSGGWRSPKGLRSNTGFPKGPATSQAQELIEEFRSLSTADCEAQLKRLLLLPGEVDPQSCTDAAHLLAFLRLGAAELRLRFANERACDHTEVALAALQALALPASGAALQADQRLRHVLVDEMQDTSDAQLALLQKLVADWEPEQESPPRTLFLVGDPQQSIYRFRQARVSRFAALLEPGARIGPVLLHRLQLQRNFRSDPELVHWCNTQLEQAFERERSPIPFAPGQPTQASSPGAQVQWQALTDAAEEAKAVCAAVRTLREQEPTARIAILGRSRGHLKPIAEALRAAGLPCAGVELEPLARTPAIRDYLALVRVLHQPLDDIAWLRLLRSPSLALPWADCDALVAKLPGLRWVERLHTEADPSAPAAWLRLRQSWLQVSRLLGFWGDLPAAARCWHADLGLRQSLDGPNLRNVQSFELLLRQHCPAGMLRDEQAFARALEGLWAAPEDAPVECMTVHKSKGLEFDHVLLVGLSRGGQGGQRPLLSAHPDADSRTLALRTDTASDDSPQLYGWFAALEKEAEAAERLRLLYVALTRARRGLQLFFAGSPQSSSLGWPLRHLDAWPASRRAEGTVPELQPVLCRPLLRAAPQPLGLPQPTRWQGAAPSRLSMQGRGRPGRLAAGESLESTLIGTSVHEALERLGREGLSLWQTQREAMQQSLSAGLARRGLPAARRGPALQRIMELLQRALQGQGLSLLQGPFRWSACEYPVSGLAEGRLTQGIIDRCFETQEGCLWVVDYKTNPAPGHLPPADWHAALRAEYSPQLGRYLNLLSTLRDHPGPSVGALYLVDTDTLLPLVGHTQATL